MNNHLFLEKISSIIGSWSFLIFQSIVFIFWILINIYFLQKDPFDPYPFILLNLLISFESAYLVPLLLMNSNRERQDDIKRASLDLEMDTKSEKLLEGIHRDIEAIKQRIGSM